jgi:hypothetical protein
MADDVFDGIQDALNLLVITTERSGNMKKELKQTIHDTVSTLRNLFVKLKNNCVEKNSKISSLEAEVSQTKTVIQSSADKAVQVQGEPSVDTTKEPAQPRAHGAPSFIPIQETTRQCVREGSPIDAGARKLYSEALASKTRVNKFKLTVSSSEQLSPDTIKRILKTKINPTEIKVGINTFRSLKDGRVLIETNSKEELETLEKDINAKCEGKLEARSHKLRNPRLVILNIPEEISLENAEDTLIAQNTDINLKQGDIKFKFCYETRKQTRNLVLEVGAQTRKLMINKKVKLGWQICKIEDYVVATRCYKCSKFNHTARSCRSEEDTCPLCAGSHKLKECSTNTQEYKCINCASYNKHNQKTPICTNHTSLDKNCPSLHAILEKLEKNTDY